MSSEAKVAGITVAGSLKSRPSLRWRPDLVVFGITALESSEKLPVSPPGNFCGAVRLQYQNVRAQASIKGAIKSKRAP